MSGEQSKRSAAPAVLVGLIVVAGAIWWLYPRPQGAGAEQEAGAGAGTAVPWVAGGAGDEGVRMLRLGRAAAIAGTIKDEDGKPIAGARVCAQARSDQLVSSETRYLRCALSGRDGHYRIAELFGVRQRVVASAAGFIPGPYFRGEGELRREWVELRAGQEALGIDITLRGGGVEIRGTVKDLSGGAIEGAEVWNDGAIALSEADGAFSLWVKPGNAWVRAVADGYATGGDSGAAPGHVFEIYLTPESVLIGKVVRASDGGPVEGAKVTASSGGEGWGRGSAVSDAGGNFRIDGLEPGAYKPVAEADDAYGLADEQVILGLGETSQPVTITAHPAFLVEGHVAVAGGDSCDDGSVSLNDRALARDKWGEITGDGTVRIQGVLPGAYEVTVRCTGRVAQERYPQVVVEKAPVTGVKWEVTRGQALRGIVVDAAGKPVENIRVRAQPKPDPSTPRAPQTSSSTQSSDAAGKFALAGLLPGTYTIHVTASDPPRATPPKPIEVTLPEGKDLEDIRIELPATGEVRGRVRDTQGRPLPRVTVRVSDGRRGVSATAADDGMFRIEHVAAGEYRATASRGFGESLRAPGTTDDDVQGVTLSVKDGAVTEIELVFEEAAGKIVGVVRDADGGPVADAFIEALRESDSAAKSAGSALRQGRWGMWNRRPHLTESDGRFEIEGLATGKYTVRANRKGGGEAVLEHVELGSDVELTIAQTGRLSGTVVLRGGATPEEFNVYLYDEATGYSRRDSFYKTGGAWSFAELPAGKYKLDAAAGGGSAEAEATMRAGEETAGIRIELAPKVTARGKVVDEDGKPVAGVDVSVFGSGAYGGADPGRKNVTDEQGRYEVANAPTGLVMIWAWAGGEEYAMVNTSARIEATGSEAELPTIELVRRRIKVGEAPGDLGFKIKEAEPGSDPLARRHVVAFVRAGGPAAAAGLQVGDEIVRVDGHDVVGGNAYLFRGLTAVREGVSVSLGLARGAELRVVADKRP